MKPLTTTARTMAVLATLAVVSVAGPAVAQDEPAGGIVMEDVECLPNNDNGVVSATVGTVPSEADVRLYFRWDDHGPFYYVAMEPEGAGRWWATPPKPTDENHQVEYYVATVDPEGTIVAQAEPMVTPVREDCDVELTRKERGMAENLIVGETDDEQMNDDVLGFLCDGIISRVGPDGVRRADSICRRCIVAWWERPELMIPPLGVVLQRPEASPSRP